MISCLLSFCGYAQLDQEDFESWPPEGWTIMDNGIGIGQSWTQSNGTPAQPPYEGTFAAYINRENVDTGAYAEDYLITPEFTMPQDAQLRFFSRLTQIEDQGSIYKVLIINPTVDDEGQPDEYTVLQTWTELQLNPTQTDYNEIQVNIPEEWYGQQVKIAFMMSGDEYDRWLIDNVKVASLCTDPFNLVSPSVGTDFITLSWNNPSWASEWEIELVSENGGFTGEGNIYGGNLPYSLNIAPGCYKYRVRALCDDGGMSEWVGPETVCTVGQGDNCETAIPITGLPYFTSGDTADNGNYYSGFPGVGCGNFGFQDFLSGNDAVYVYTADFSGEINISLSNMDFFTGVFIYSQCEDIGSSCIAGNANVDSNFTVNDLPIFINNFEVTAGESYIIVISSWYSNLSTPYDLAIQNVSCDPPTNLSITQAGSTEVWLSWEDIASITSWEVSVQPAGAGMPMGAGEYTTEINSEFPVPISENLQPLTEYEFWVRGICDDGTFGNWSIAYTFETSFCTGNSCVYTFDMWSLGGEPWFGNSMNVIQDGTVIETLTGPLQWAQGHVYQDVIMCDGLPFELFWNPGGDFPVNVGIAVTNEYGQEIFSKPPVTGEQNTTLYNSDQIYCEFPECQPPMNVSASDITINSANISWDNTFPGTWQYYVVEAGLPAPDGNTVDGIIATTSNLITLTGLEQATNYEIYVRLLCDQGPISQSSWGGPVAFSTASCLPENKCDYVFTMQSSGSDWVPGWNGYTMEIYQDGVFVTSIGSTFTSGSSQDIIVPLCNDVPFEIFWVDGEGTMGLQVHNSFGQLIYNLPPTTGTADMLNTIIFESESIDCFNPSCIAPVNLTATNATPSTIDLSWNGAIGGSWQYYILEAGSPAPGNDTVGIDTDTTIITATLESPATYYEFYVRETCATSETGFTEWAGPVSFYSTLCNAEDKCTFYAELKSASGVGYLGNTMTILQGGVPAHTVGNTFDWSSPNMYSQIIEIPLCAGEDIELFWNLTFANDNDLGITLYSPFMEVIYDLPVGAGVGLQGTTLFAGSISCDPPVCIKPQEPIASNFQANSVTLDWQEIGDANIWEICVLPSDSEMIPTPNVIVTEHPYMYGNLEDEILLPSAPYKFYVRSNCGDDVSSWAGPFYFASASVNDECPGAIPVPVNPGVECIESIVGTITGSTSSGMQSSCNYLMPDRDVWFSFIAAAQTHVITGSSNNGIAQAFSVYSGDGCGNLEELDCAVENATIPVTPAQLKLSGLVPGQQYYIQVFNISLIDSDFTSFGLCITTPQSIITDTSTYAVEALIQQMLIPSPCIEISNITWNTGTDFSTSNGIAYFEKGNSNFPIDKGLLLMTGDATNAPGPNIGASMGDGTWPPDQQLVDFVADNYLDEAFDWTIYGPVFYDATLIEFDFVPSVDRIKFPVIFASEAYGAVQTSSYDIFAILLTTDDGTGPTTTNIALVPGTQDPIGVGTIMNDEINSVFQYPPVLGINEEYFGGYYGNSYQIINQDLVLSPYDTPINFNGNTVEMIVETDVTPGQLYHIKMVVADREYPMSAYDAAAFIGPFTAGIVDLGDDLIVNSGNAICPGGSMTIYSHLDPQDYTFQWFNDNGAIEGATGPDLLVTEPGTYSLDAAFSENCHATDDIIVEFYDEVVQPTNLTECSSTGFATFDLNDITVLLLEGAVDPENIIITYHASEGEAVSNENPLTQLYTNITQDVQSVFARVENTITGCIATRGFDLIVLDLIPQFNLGNDFSICTGTDGIIQAEPINFDPDTVEYSWTYNNAPIGNNSDSLTVTEAGVYGLTVNNAGCMAAAEITVSVISPPIAIAPNDVIACGSYVLPILPEDNSYFTGSGGTGNQYNAGDIITESQTIFVFAQTSTMPNCTAENSFEVTVNALTIPVTGFTLPSVVCIASSDITPLLVEGFTPGGIFSSSIGLSINEQTGLIDLSESMAGNYTVTYTVVEDMSNCVAGASTASVIEITPALIPEAAFSFEEVYCDTSTIVFPEVSENFVIGGVFTSTEGLVINPLTGGIDIMASESGDYTVTYTIQPDLDNCMEGNTFSDSFIIDQRLRFNLEQYCEGSDYYVKANAIEGTFDSVTFEWFNAQGSPVGVNDVFNVTDYAELTEPNIFPLELMLTIVSNGCEYSEIAIVEDILCEVPKGISPNNDGMNDNLDLTGFDVLRIEIFNRYGLKVYSRQNYNDEWHGQADNGDDLPTGTYFYIIERANGESFTGWIYISREMN